MRFELQPSWKWAWPSFLLLLSAFTPHGWQVLIRLERIEIVSSSCAEGGRHVKPFLLPFVMITIEIDNDPDGIKKLFWHFDQTQFLNNSKITRKKVERFFLFFSFFLLKNPIHTRDGNGRMGPLWHPLCGSKIYILGERERERLAPPYQPGSKRADPSRTRRSE
jgi:hypothetical protein